MIFIVIFYLFLFAKPLGLTEIPRNDLIESNQSTQSNHNKYTKNLSGECGPNLTYTIQSGELTISGIGEMYNFSYPNQQPWNYIRNITSVIILPGVTTIGYAAFYYCENITSVIIPDTITFIFTNAFASCYSLNKINIPEGIEYIGQSAFHMCYSLPSIIIPKSTTLLGIQAFYHCTNITTINMVSINIHEDFEYMDMQVFSYCYKLKKVILPKKAKFIGERCFYACDSLEEIIFPDGPTDIGAMTFGGCDVLHSIIIGKDVKSIAEDAFIKCVSLEYVVFIGLNSPSYNGTIFADSNVNSVLVTNNYQDQLFCGYPIEIMPTPSIEFTISNHFSKSDVFSMSNDFTESSHFSKSDKFSMSNDFTESSHFSKSDKFSMSNDFTKSSHFSKSDEFSMSSYFTTNSRFSEFTEKNHFTKSDKLSKSYSLISSLTFIEMKSVSFSLSFSLSNSFLLSYNNLKTLFIINTQSDYSFYFPYIIYYFSPSYSYTYMIYDIKSEKRLNGEQIIGITCGSASLFFLVLYIIIRIYNNNNLNKIENELSLTSDSEQNNFQNSEKETLVQQIETNNDNIDLWI